MDGSSVPRQGKPFEQATAPRRPQLPNSPQRLLPKLRRLGRRNRRNRPALHGDLTLPGHLIPPSPPIDLKMLKQPNTPALDHEVVARPNPKHKVGVVVHVVLNDLKKPLDARPRLTLRRFLRR